MAARGPGAAAFDNGSASTSWLLRSTSGDGVDSERVIATVAKHSPYTAGVIASSPWRSRAPGEDHDRIREEQQSAQRGPPDGELVPAHKLIVCTRRRLVAARQELRSRQDPACGGLCTHDVLVLAILWHWPGVWAAATGEGLCPPDPRAGVHGALDVLDDGRSSVRLSLVECNADPSRPKLA